MEFLSDLHLAICGHAKHGKSTLAGRLAFELEAISAREISAYGEEARQRGKDFNKFSIMFLQHRSNTFSKGTAQPDDSSRTEFPMRSSVSVKGTRLTLIDTPGFSRFLDNIVYGIYLADKAIVVVEAQSGVTVGTEAVCRILQAFEIPVVAFCVTKMDVIGYSEVRFSDVGEEIKERLIDRYKLGNAPIVPVSALEGPGIVISENSYIGWYEGENLLEIVKGTQKQTVVELAKNTRLAVEGPREILSPVGIGTVIVGSLETGIVEVGQTLIAEPHSTTSGKLVSTQVRSVHLARGVNESQTHAQEAVAAKAILSIGVPGWSRREASSIFRKGGVLGSPESRPRVATSTIADVIFFEVDTVYNGKEYKIHPHVMWTMARLERIFDKNSLSYDLVTDEYVSSPGELVHAQIQFRSPCCIEAVSDIPRLAKFVVREQNRVVACGMRVEVIE